MLSLRQQELCLVQASLNPKLVREAEHRPKLADEMELRYAGFAGDLFDGEPLFAHIRQHVASLAEPAKNIGR
jgi:hypothetical protein